MVRKAEASLELTFLVGGSPVCFHVDLLLREAESLRKKNKKEDKGKKRKVKEEEEEFADEEILLFLVSQIKAIEFT